MDDWRDGLRIGAGFKLKFGSEKPQLRQVVRVILGREFSLMEPRAYFLDSGLACSGWIACSPGCLVRLGKIARAASEGDVVDSSLPAGFDVFLFGAVPLFESADQICSAVRSSW